MHASRSSPFSFSSLRLFLCAHRLFWGADANSLKKSISLADVVTVRDGVDAKTLAKLKGAEKDCAFSIVCSAKTIELVARDTHTRDAWVQFLSEATG